MRWTFGILLSLCLVPVISAQHVEVLVRDNAIYFSEGGDSILGYQVVPKSLDGQFSRSNYIHPLYALDGTVLTEDFPADHLHHRGIFWAWHQLYVGDRRIGDGWEISDFSWDVVQTQLNEVQGGAKELQTDVLWTSPAWTDDRGAQRPVVREHTRITVYPLYRGLSTGSGNYRQVDIEISLLALHAGMRIGGSEDEKGYGGFSARVRLPADIEFTGPAGRVAPENLPVAAGGWLDISGSLGRGGAQAGLSILCHPNNPGYPGPWILRSAASMQNAVYPHPGARPVPLSATEPTVLRYRLLIHNGNMAYPDIAGIHTDFARQ